MSLALKLFCVFSFFLCLLVFLTSLIFCLLLSWLQALFKFIPSKIKGLINIYLFIYPSMYIFIYLSTYQFIYCTNLHTHKTHMKSDSLQENIYIYSNICILCFIYYYNHFPNNIWQGISHYKNSNEGEKQQENL